MDERLMKKCIGQPVPEWDMMHRLPIDRPVGPDMWDTGTIFRMNSTYMDVTEPSFLEKQWFITGVVLAFVFMGIGPYIYNFTHSGPPRRPSGCLFSIAWHLLPSCFSAPLFGEWVVGSFSAYGAGRSGSTVASSSCTRSARDASS
ncbi:hypothetical protein [Paraburkholderia flava]|uniref:hypothetical protein n=1 Tax=Paraburkholderia flava TaxID=2547393 RepID=UPI001F10CF02|nr:hypothetical protein [Paraburkholderia flava]